MRLLTGKALWNANHELFLENRNVPITLIDTSLLFVVLVSNTSPFEEQFKELTSLITYFDHCSRETQEFIENMRQKLKDSIETDLITDTERQRLLSFSEKKATLLVVGQTNSGKSSFVNELLGGSFMPTSELPCTSRIVRLKFSEENYYQVSSTLQSKIINRGGSLSAFDKLKCLEKRGPYVVAL